MAINLIRFDSPSVESPFLLAWVFRQAGQGPTWLVRGDHSREPSAWLCQQWDPGRPIGGPELGGDAGIPVQAGELGGQVAAGLAALPVDPDPRHLDQVVREKGHAGPLEARVYAPPRQPLQGPALRFSGCSCDICCPASDPPPVTCLLAIFVIAEKMERRGSERGGVHPRKMGGNHTNGF